MRTATISALLALATGLAQAAPTLTEAMIEKRDLLPGNSLPKAHDEGAGRYQPLMDFDMDGCYSTAAIDTDGNVNPGLSVVGTGGPSGGGCRDANRLGKNNVYSRTRCNNGICAYMYDYYFEKDQTTIGGGGHTHDWETIVVFVQGDRVFSVQPSCHGEYIQTDPAYLDGDRPKVVYHKDGGLTHCFRQGRADDDAVENDTGSWYTADLVGYNNWPEGLQGKLFDAFPSGIAPKIWDGSFADNLEMAGANAGALAMGFNPDVDG